MTAPSTPLFCSQIITSIFSLALLTGCTPYTTDHACDMGGVQHHYSLQKINNATEKSLLEIDGYHLYLNKLENCKFNYCYLAKGVFSSEIRRHGGLSDCSFTNSEKNQKLDTFTLAVAFENGKNVTFAGWDQQDFPQTNIRQYGIAYLRSNETGIHTSLDPNNTYHQLDMSVTVNNVDDIVITIDSTSVTMAQYLVENPQ